MATTVLSDRAAPEMLVESEAVVVVQQPNYSKVATVIDEPLPALSLQVAGFSSLQEEAPRHNERDDKGSFDKKDSVRQESSNSPTFLHYKVKEQTVATCFDGDNHNEHTNTEKNLVESESVVEKGIIQPCAINSCGSITTTDSTKSDDFTSDDEDELLVLQHLENVTQQSRSLIDPDLFKNKPPLHPRGKKMATPAVSDSNGAGKKRGMFGKRFSTRRNTREDEDGDESGSHLVPAAPVKTSSTSDHKGTENEAEDVQNQRPNRRSAHEAGEAPRRGVLQRLRSVSRSRRSKVEGDEEALQKPILVAVTSCRSDAYYNQKAPGSTSKLPRKAPSNLKLFHELAVGIKDAYAAVGQTPSRPEEDENDESKMEDVFMEGKTVLWEFIGNLDFLLALVDEVAIDTATRGALKDDNTFKSLRDVIKKCNKVLEGMLVRRERRYTLFFRLVQASEPKEIAKIKSWNSKVEKAIGSVADDPEGNGSTSESESDVESIASSLTDGSSKGGMFGRGRQLLPAAGRVRSRRATPVPTLRNRASSDSDSSAAEDGFAADASVTRGNLAALQKSIGENSSNGSIPALMPAAPAPNQPKLGGDTSKPVAPKDELIDVIRGLRVEKIQKREGTAESDLADLKPNWQPKADIPSSVPKLPTEYIHRHRLMKQVVNCLLDQSGAGPRDMDEEVTGNTIITSITSRHADKPGNGKTTLAVATIQSVEVRERFCDGIAWIQLGRNPLTEKEVRRLYEELFRQLVAKDDDENEADEDNVSHDGSKEDNKSDPESSSKLANLENVQGLGASQNAIRLAESRQRFQGGELDAIKEDLSNIITKRKILICLDDVWRVDDAKWFIFDNNKKLTLDDPSPYRILLTTRTPSLLGQGVMQEVFVRIFSEHEAVKLLLSSAGRRPYGGKQSTVFNQARIIVKGCGNSPMAVRLAGGMLRRWSRNWNLSCPTWTSLIEQSKRNLEEASRLRSFSNSVTRIVDLGFACIDDMEMRVAIRRCFITYAVLFRDNDWVHVGKGIPQAVLLKLFDAVVGSKAHTGEHVLAALEKMHLFERARHGTTAQNQIFKKLLTSSDSDDGFEDEEDAGPTKSSFLNNPSFVMQDSLRAVGEDMAKREEPAFLPQVDSFTSFTSELKEEHKFHDSRRGLIGGALRFISKRLTGENSEYGLQEAQVHEVIAACLVGLDRIKSTLIEEAFRKSKDTNKTVVGGEKLEEYMAVFLPSHLIRSQYYAAAGVILVDSHFIRRRVKALGVAEATRKQVADLLELRREFAKDPKPQKAALMATNGSASTNTDSLLNEPQTVDTSLILRDGCRTIVDEVHRVVSSAKGSAESLSMAICLSTVGEALMKGKQPRDAMLRLEEAVIIYRSLLGENHVDVARSLHSVARALVRLGENRVALHKFTEAAEIYERCKATMHYDSIANSQNLATLLVDLKEWEKAASCFDDVISKKKAVYGAGSVSVAKTINSYAILLAKHGRMDQALKNYEAAKATYEAVPPSLLQDAEFDIKCKYDITLINLNIASIRSKKGDLLGAIKSYSDGVRGLRQYEASQEKLVLTTGVGETGKNSSHVKHLVAALGRIGSLKLKVGDNTGALEAYRSLLDEVEDDSPQASRVEAAKAHIKCATIYRQQEGNIAHSKSISHLREALEMYTVLFGPQHKDTLAIASSLRQWLSEEPAKSEGEFAC